MAAELKGAEMADAVLSESHVQVGGRLDGVTLREARVVVSQAGRVEQMTQIGLYVQKKSLTPAQGAALVRYREAHEMASLGLFGTGLNPDQVGGSGQSTGGNHRIETAVADGILLAKMRAALPLRAVNLVEHVAVHGLTTTSWAASQITGREGVMNPTRAMGML